MKPKLLKKGDTIGIIAPSKPFNPKKEFELNNFIKYMEERGFKIKLSRNFFEKDKFGVSAGTPEMRASDFNDMVQDKEIDAIWCFQGGDTANQILNLIDYELIKKNPKIILGKSDIDLLLLAVNKMTGLKTIHCCDPKIGSNKELDFEYTKKWFDKRIIQGLSEVEPCSEWTCINEGTAEGKIIGCNLITIIKMAGTKYFPDFADSIFFLETFRTTLPDLVWQVAHLKNLGVFEKTKGVVIGNNFEFRSEEYKVEEIIKDLISEYNLPILKINEFGHYQPHAFLPIGARLRLDATNKKIEIIEDFAEKQGE